MIEFRCVLLSLLRYNISNNDNNTQYPQLTQSELPSSNTPITF